MSPYILGVNSAYHEASACLVHEGRLLSAVEEERFNRVKHGKHSRVDNAHELPWSSIDFCLQQAGIDAEAVSHIGYSFDPEARRAHNRELPDSGRVPAGDFGSPEGEETFYQSNLEAARLLRERFPRAELHFLPHHLCHAASAYTVSPFEEAAVLTIDGIGEFHSTFLGVGSGGRLEPLAAIPYPHSLGFLWERFSELLGFDVYGGPGKMMGYGCITDPIGELSGRDYLAIMRDIVRLHPSGSFFVDNDVMRFRTSDFSELEKRFGKRRPGPVDRYEDASIAAALQLRTEDVILNLCRGLHEMATARRPRGAPPLDSLCMAGGVALNCVANSRILRETPFRRLWVQPAANDAGTAVGAAAYLHCQVLGLPGRPRMRNAFCGPAFDEPALEAALQRANVAYRRPDDLVREVAGRVESGQIVAWFQGALEFGPRALGHRTILADPTRFDARARLNSQVKMRESFRPFAPSVMAEDVPHLFELDDECYAADFMLLAGALRDDRFSQLLPAVVQENGSTHRSTARLHRVRIEDDQLYHALVEEMKGRIGVGAVLNTSFNVSEPIVATPDHALATFAKSKMSALALGPFLVEGRA